MARLTEQIAEAEAAHQAAKAQRNAAQDQRKEAWRTETELKDKVGKTQAEFDKAFAVSPLSQQPCRLSDALTCGCARALLLFRSLSCPGTRHVARNMWRLQQHMPVGVTCSQRHEV